MRWFRKSSADPQDTSFPWIDLKDRAVLDEALQGELSVIFKHSTRCSISSMAKNRLENGTGELPDVPFYYLDVIAHRDLSNAIAEALGVQHESPQLLVVSRGKVLFHTSHNGISRDALLGAVA